MCGDVAEGIELAVGVPHPVGEPREPSVGEKLLNEMPALSQEEIDEYSRAEDARRVRVDAAPLTNEFTDAMAFIRPGFDQMPDEC